MKRPTSPVFLLTDCCMWEANKTQGTFHPHAIEVVDITTGQTRYIKSGARIRLIDGQITDGRNQEDYNHHSAITPKQKKPRRKAT